MGRKELIHNLVKTLEQLEDKLEFTVFYSFAEFLKSKHFTPAFEFEGYYYEIQYDNSDKPQVLRWIPQIGNNSEGAILSKVDIKELTDRLCTLRKDKQVLEDLYEFTKKLATLVPYDKFDIVRDEWNKVMNLVEKEIIRASK